MNFYWKLHKMILLKEAEKMRHEPTHYLEKNRVVYSLSDVVR